jgi:hypothetical protein
LSTLIRGSAARAGVFVVWIRLWIGSERVWIEGFAQHPARADTRSSGGVDQARRTRRRGTGVPPWGWGTAAGQAVVWIDALVAVVAVVVLQEAVRRCPVVACGTAALGS